MKKIFSSFLLIIMISFGSCNSVFCKEKNTDSEKKSIQTINEEVLKEAAVEISEAAPEVKNSKVQNIETSSKKLNKKEYKRSTIFKYYTPYEITFKNKNKTPILMTTKTEIEFIKNDNSVLKSDTRRDIYMRSRKKDRGRHYALQVPGAILGSCISIGTLFLGTPVGYGVYKAMQRPTVKAARTNVNISQDLYSSHGLPIVFEPDVEYAVYFYPAKSKDTTSYIKTVRIKNVSFNNKIQDIEVPLINSNSLIIDKYSDEGINPADNEKADISEEEE